MRLVPFARSTLLVLIATALGCTDVESPQTPSLLVDLDDAPVFLAQSEPPGAVMEALFDGRVILDDAGCFRLDIGSPEDATVVWPFGADLERADGAYRVLDVDGRTVGTVGERFRFGGGFVSRLHDGIPLDESARARAEAQCPGAYWIVGEIP